MDAAIMRTGKNLALALALAATGAASTACQRRQIDVVKTNGDRTGDYGRQALRAAVQKFRGAPRSPEAYRAMAVEIERIRPAFNQDVADEAERGLSFLALGPMAAQLDRPFEEQMAALALTVWPTAIRLEPQASEAARAYLERACSSTMSAECKYVVPEYWPLVLSARVWKRMKDRARDAYSECRQCKQDPTFAALLEEYEQDATRVIHLAKAEEGRVERSAWPEAGTSASDWSGAPVLDLVADPPLFMGEPVEGSWRARLRASRRGNGHDKVLAVHLRPRSEVRHLRDAVRSAAAAGYQAVALQVRGHAYPYPLREYRIATRGGGRAIDVRDVDTIQYLVRTLDAAAARGGGAFRLTAAR
ncbi:MAG TPA: hypothetical protein VKB80_36285 [Kofleriaceae bacterium]|nr:hypothetical protein [Kofleriaceae bacterium]